MTVNIICLKWGTKYGPEYVNRLYSGFKRNTTIPFKFHCFTDSSLGLKPDIIVHKLPNNDLTGWWNKLYLFSKDLPISGRVVFADLDTLIVRNVDDIISYDKGFVILRDLYVVEKDAKTNKAQSALMSFDAHKHAHIWEKFYPTGKQIAAKFHPYGDQVWIEQQQPDRVYWQDLFPKQIVSFKVSCREQLPAEARIVCYHGVPSIVDSITKTVIAQGRVCNPSPWVADHWRD